MVCASIRKSRYFVCDLWQYKDTRYIKGYLREKIISKIYMIYMYENKHKKYVPSIPGLQANWYFKSQT